MTDGGSLAIDAGQSGIKVRHADAAGASEWAGPGIRTDLPLLPQLARVMEDAVEAGRSFDEVGLGVSGLTSDEADAGYLLAATAQHGVRAVHLAHDSITAYLGALGDDRGAVVASGTGVVTLAVGRTELARVDGWGYLLGDAGSGYWLGRAALDAVMRAHDGRGDATALSAIALAEFPDLEHAYIELQADPGRVGRIAAYARHVADAAAAGDAVALAIVSEAGRELAASVIAGLRRVGEADAAAPRVRAVGGVFGGSALTAAFTSAVLEGCRRRRSGSARRIRSTGRRPWPRWRPPARSPVTSPRRPWRRTRSTLDRLSADHYIAPCWGASLVGLRGEHRPSVLPCTRRDDALQLATVLSRRSRGARVFHHRRTHHPIGGTHERPIRALPPPRCGRGRQAGSAARFRRREPDHGAIRAGIGGDGRGPPPRSPLIRPGRG